MTETVRPEIDVAGNLRQLIAALECERQALAGLDPDGLNDATRKKEHLCISLAAIGEYNLDAESLSLARTAQHLNEVNRRARNLLAANVAQRLTALGTARGYSVTGQIASA